MIKSPETPLGVWYPDATEPYPEAGWWQQHAESIDDTIMLDSAEGVAASHTLTVPSGHRSVRVVGYGRSDAALISTTLRVTLNGQDTGAQYRTQRIEWAGTSAPSVAAGTEDTVQVSRVPAGDALSGMRGWVDLLLVALDTTLCSFWAQGGAVPTATDTDSRIRQTSGIATIGPVTTIQLFPGSGSFTAGTRFELRAS